MKISLIVSTYNSKDTLELVLLSVLRQTLAPKEIIVADDGSTDGTDSLVSEIQQKTSVHIVHCWQEDNGFRAARSRNLAIAASTGDYLVFVDGDMILERHFLEDHRRASQLGQFIQGGRVIMTAEKSRLTINNKTLDFHCWESGLENRKNCLRSWFLSTLFSKRSNRLTGIRTCNFALWRNDALTVNGFNENFIGWGREDSEFAARLLHSGIGRKNLRFQAIGYHLFHPLQERNSLENNDAILRDTINKKLRRCPNGVDHHKTKTQPFHCS